MIFFSFNNKVANCKNHTFYGSFRKGIAGHYLLIVLSFVRTALSVSCLSVFDFCLYCLIKNCFHSKFFLRSIAIIDTINNVLIINAKVFSEFNDYLLTLERCILYWCVFRVLDVNLEICKCALKIIVICYLIIYMIVD